MSDQPIIIGINEEELFPVCSHEVVGLGGSHWFPGGTFQVSSTELARLERLGALEARVHRLYNKLLHRIERRGETRVHVNADGSFVVIKEQPDGPFGRDPLGTGCTCRQRGCEHHDCQGRCGCVLHGLEHHLEVRERKVEPLTIEFGPNGWNPDQNTWCESKPAEAPAPAPATEEDPPCDCKTRGCTDFGCKGHCGCMHCHWGYQDALSSRGD